MAEPVVECKVSGLDELQKALEDLEANVAKKGIRLALRAGGDIAQSAIVDAAPERTGFLKKHFGIRISLKSGKTLAGSAFIGPEGMVDYPQDEDLLAAILQLSKAKAKKALKGIKGRISVKSVVRYLEFGTTKMSKKPFMTQAFEQKQEKIITAMSESLKATIEEG